MERLQCAAIYINDNQNHVKQPFNISIGYVVGGLRHFHCRETIRIFRPDFDFSNEIAGFLTNQNRFVDRYEAFLIAQAANQIIHKMHDGKVCEQLTSEDLYWFDESYL